MYLRLERVGKILQFTGVCCLWILLSLTILAAPTAAGYEKEIDTLAEQMAARIGGYGDGTVAVVDFTDVQGGKTELGRFLAEELSVALLNTTHQIRIVDRAHLSRILEESKLGESGVVDPRTAQELGRVAGVDVLITGTTTLLADSVRLTVKALETETAKVVAGQRVTIPATDELRQLMNRGLAPGGASTAPAIYTKAYNIETREAGGLKVTVRSVRVLEEGRVTGVFEITNTRSSPVTIFVDQYDYNSAAYDERGNYFPQSLGLANGGDCVVGYGGDDGLYIEAGETQQITEVYRGERDVRPGRRFSLRFSLRICDGVAANIPRDRPGSGDGVGRGVQFSFADVPADASSSENHD